MDVAGYILKP